MNNTDLNPAGVAEQLIEMTAWASYRRLGGGSAESVGAALSGLLRAGKDEVAPVRDLIETEVAVQANLYSAAEPTIRVLAASFVDERPRWVRISALDLMYLILSGAPAPEELERGEVTLQARCVVAARESLWSLVRVAMSDSICLEAVLDVVRLIEPGGPAARLLELGGHAQA